MTATTDTTAITLDRDIIFGSHRYPFYVREPGSWPEFACRAAALAADRFIVIADTGVPSGLLEGVTSRLKVSAPVTVYCVPPGEKAKTLGTVTDMINATVACGATRRSVMVAVGGGMVGNMAGLTAALTFRGLRLLHVPTTALAASDSVLSGKQGINSDLGKNHVGTFHWPEFVWCDLGVFASLPRDEIRAAWCELIKNVVGILPSRYAWAATTLNPAADYSLTDIIECINLCIDAKTKVMAADPYESGPALVLEYGHTVGHAIELLTGGDIGHGYAIGLGGLAEAQVAVNAGYLSAADMDAHRALLTANGAPTTIPDSLATDRIVQTIRLDNKRGYPDQPPPRPGMAELVLLDGLGQPHLNARGGLITQVPFEDVAAAIDQSLRPGGPR
jgi:3-dehydroquinate synthetase